MSKCLTFVLALLLINLQVASAASVLGKVTTYPPNSSHPEVFPLVSGNKVTYGNQALIKINGATLMAEKGTVFEAFDYGDSIFFRVDKGKIVFRLIPQKARVLFKTGHGEIFSTKVVKASTSTVEARIIVNESETLVMVDQGRLRAKTSEGITEVETGKPVLLSHAELTPELEKLLIGKNGITLTVLNPDGIVQIEERILKAEVVDDNFKKIDGAKLKEGTKVRVVGIRKGSIIALVQPLQLLPNDDGNTELESALTALSIASGLFIPPIILTATEDESDRRPTPDGS